MKSPEIPHNEKERLDVLYSTNLVYSVAEERFDRITRLAQRIFDVPIALISLVGENIQWFKSCQGLPVAETSREISFCGHAILRQDALVIPDTLKDEDYADNPLVIGEPHIRFYAGHPIQLDAVNLGTLCLIDSRPRRFTESDIDTLKSLALWVENELKLSLYSVSQKELMEKVTSLQRKSLIDSDTACWNQKGLDKLSSAEMSRSRRNNEPVALILLEFGYQSGLSKLIVGKTRQMFFKAMAQRIRRSLRPHDMVAKLKDKRFMVLLTNCNSEMASTLSQRILRNISVERLVLSNNKVKPAVKIGVTCNDDTDIWSYTLLSQVVEDALDKEKQKKRDSGFSIIKPKRPGQ